jgi:hypothetical protein
MKKQSITCKCVGKHVPLPTRLVEFNGISVCPTTYENIMEYKKMWEVLGTEPPGNIRKHFSEFVQDTVRLSIDKQAELV